MDTHDSETSPVLPPPSPDDPNDTPTENEGPVARFDPYTGKPLEPQFDPYTGRPLEETTRKPQRSKWLYAGIGAGAVVVAIILVVVLSGGSGTKPLKIGPLAPKTHDLLITLDVTNASDPSINKFSKGCDVSDTGYDDLSAGAPVSVKDGQGKVLASAFLPSGTDGGSDVCHFSLTVKVPDSDFYQIEVSRRGVLTYSKQALVSNGWAASLSIGS